MIDKNKKTIWRSRFGFQPLLDGTKRVLYYEDVAVVTASFSIAAFVLATGASWFINIDGVLPRPPACDSPLINNGFLTHLGYWSKAVVHKVLPFAFAESVSAYHRYIELLDQKNLLFCLAIRFYAGMIAGAFGAWKGFSYAIRKPVETEITHHKRGMQVYKGTEAENMLRPLMKDEIDQSGKFAQMSTKLDYSTFRLIRHHIIFGASGTGKSQYMYSSIVEAINTGLKSFILDPKFEFTGALYKGDGTNAILDATDKRSFVWDIAYDLKSIGLMKKFAAAIIPKGGDNPMWSNAARSVFVGMLVYLKQNFKDENGKPNYTWSDISDMVTLPANELVHIMQNYYPEALSLIGEIDHASGNVTTNVTTAGIMINLLSFMGGIRDLSRFWYDSDAPKLSLFNFMTQPDHPIKTLFVKPNDVEAEMSTGLVRAMLIYSISLLDSPNIPNSKTVRGAFFLDEFHAPGKLLNEVDQPVIDKLIDRGRSKGWGAFLATQNIIQLYKIYSKDDVNSWKETTSTFILTGAPLGVTATEICEFLGEQFIDKLHTSMTRQPDGANTTTNYQEHNRKVLLPSELSSELNPTKTGIRLLALLRGMPDVYILDKPYVDIAENAPHWIEREQLDTAVNPNSRARALIGQQMRGIVEAVATESEQQANPVLSAADLLEQQLIDANPVFEDYGQYADPQSPEEIAHISQQSKIYNITEGEEDSITQDLLKDHGLETMTDSHALGMVLNVAEALMTPQKQVTTDKNKYQQIKAELEKAKYQQQLKIK
ncbi:MAG: hypothetical protein C4294_18500 [Nitrospiraceae bacterium]